MRDFLKLLNREDTSMTSIVFKLITFFVAAVILMKLLTFIF